MTSLNDIINKINENKIKLKEEKIRIEKEESNRIQELYDSRYKNFFHINENDSSSSAAGAGAGGSKRRTPGIITTDIIVTPSGVTMFPDDIQQIGVVNQDDIDVIDECVFESSSDSVASVSSDGLITSLISGSTIISVTHDDGPSGTTIVTSINPTISITIIPASKSFSNPGQTQQLVVNNQDGRDVLDECSFESNNTTHTVTSGGLVESDSYGNSVITVTHIEGPTNTCNVYTNF